MADGYLDKLQSAYNLSKDLLDLKGAIASRAAVSELQKELSAALVFGVDAAKSQNTQIAEIHDLKEEVARFKAWGADKERYEMQRIDPGVILYAIRPESANGEPFHQLCANCYDRGQKSKLQTTPRIEMRYRVHYCPLCKSEFAFNYVAPPASVRSVGRDGSLFRR